MDTENVSFDAADPAQVGPVLLRAFERIAELQTEVRALSSLISLLAAATDNPLSKGVGAQELLQGAAAIILQSIPDSECLASFAHAAGERAPPKPHLFIVPKSEVTPDA